MGARDRLREWMRDEGLTQADVARLISATQGAVSMLLRGETAQPRLDIAHSIETASASWKHGPIRTEEWLLPVDATTAATGTEG
jgi:transcriptional regulator with XRE-family HTH domain